MKALDIVAALAARVPRHTAGFSESIGLVSIVPAGTVATATTAVAHGISEGERVSVLGALAPVQIDPVTFLRTGTQAVFETLQDHDFTLSDRDRAGGGKSLTIFGAVEAEFNGTFAIIQVVNRRKLIISVADAGPTTITGSPIVESANGDIFNGYVTAYNVAPTTFDYDLQVAYTLPAVVTSAAVQTGIRIAACLDIEQFLRDITTKQTPTNDMLVVQLGDVSASKKRDEQTDASSSATAGATKNPILIQSFAIYIVMNVTDDISAVVARDKVESEYIPAIFKAVARARFPTGFTYTEYLSTFIGHGVFAYATQVSKGKALYVHEITFEQLVQITGADMAPAEPDVAMRDIDYTILTNLGTGTMTAAVNLDDEPQ